MDIVSSVDRARANVERLKLYVPNSFSYGVVKALDIFGSTYAYAHLINNRNKLRERSSRRVSAVGRKSLRDWKSLSDDLAFVIANTDMELISISGQNKKEVYGKRTSGIISRSTK